MKHVLRWIEEYVSWIKTPIAPRSLGLFRMWFGFLCLVNLILLWPDLEMWLGNDGVFPPVVHQKLVMGARLSLYSFWGLKDVVITLIRVLGIAGVLSLILGVLPRLGALFLWMVMISVTFRNPNILNSGDTLMRLVLFFLMFAESDQAFSLRRRWQVRTGLRNADDYALIPAWPVRIIQLQLCLVYLVTAIWKSKGYMWQDGTAVGVVLQLGDFHRLPIPDFLVTPLASKLMTWFTLLIEFGFPILVWEPKFRVPIMLAGLALHAGLDWVMNVQLFQWTITSLYILFLTPNLEWLSNLKTRMICANRANCRF